jgi:hypothetical protein
VAKRLGTPHPPVIGLKTVDVSTAGLFELNGKVDVSERQFAPVARVCTGAFARTNHGGHGVLVRTGTYPCPAVL